jgi:formylglycine-generating enzyme required for sulfatase activity
MDTSANGYRLPTEAQWEYADRGGKMPSISGTFANKWAGTNEKTNPGNYAWYLGNLSRATHKAGKKGANTLKLYDMCGNVYEWYWDWYGGISTGSADNPTGSDTGPTRRLRGNDWNSNAPNCTVSYRGPGYPVDGGSSIGFRVACP